MDRLGVTIPNKNLKQQKFKLLQLDSFYDFANPLNHVRNFEAKWSHIAIGRKMCLAFQTNLKSSAYIWFYCPKSENIGSFEQLAMAFAQNFTTSMIRDKDINSLSKMRQYQVEVIQDFITKFAWEMIEAENID